MCTLRSLEVRGERGPKNNILNMCDNTGLCELLTALVIDNNVCDQLDTIT